MKETLEILQNQKQDMLDYYIKTRDKNIHVEMRKTDKKIKALKCKMNYKDLK